MLKFFAGIIFMALAGTLALSHTPSGSRLFWDVEYSPLVPSAMGQVARV